jgi:hypothetical protein
MTRLTVAKVICGRTIATVDGAVTGLNLSRRGRPLTMIALSLS